MPAALSAWAISARRQLHEFPEPEVRVAGRSLPPGGVPAGEAREEDAEHRGLDRVEPRVHPDELEGPLVT